MTSATDNRTTERLMAMLEERGVKHELEHDIYVEWVDARGNEVTAFETSCKHKGDVLIVHVFLTPEQAIAATLGEQIIRCRDCKHATISTTGVCKYCEMFVLPDMDGYGADPQVNLPLDFFCGFAERKEADE